MIKSILTLLQFDDFYICDPHIDVAKGKYELTGNIREYRKQKKRWLKIEE